MTIPTELWAFLGTTGVAVVGFSFDAWRRVRAAEGEIDSMNKKIDALLRAHGVDPDRGPSYDIQTDD